MIGVNLCDMMPLKIAQISYYESYVIKCTIICVSDMSEKYHFSALYDSYQSILSRTINTTVLTRIEFSTDTIVPEESSHIRFS